MSLGTLAAVVAFLNVLLCVIPCAARVGHEHCEHNAGDKRACEQAGERGGTENDTDQQGNNNGHDTGNEHLLQSGGGGDGNAGLVVGLGGAFHNAGDLTELTADFFDHAVSSLGNGVHGHGGEDEGKHAADEQADNYVGVCQGDGVGGKAGGLSKGYEQSQSGQSSGADCKALAHCRGGVADSVELIGDLADGVIQTAHLGDAACVIGDGAVCVNCYGDAGGGEHTDCREGNAVYARKPVCEENAEADEDDGDPGGHHADRGAGDDGRG